MKKASRQRERGRPAFEVMDGAAYLVRRAPWAAHGAYLTGTLPFLAGMLYFWNTMSHSPSAHLEMPAGALALAVLFIWMKAWQARYATILWSVLAEDDVKPWSLWGFLRTAARQGVIHATALFLMSFAVVTIVPLAWMHTLYQNCTVLDGQEDGGVRHLFKQALRNAARWPRQYYMLAWLLSPLLVCFASVICFLVIPALEGSAEEWVVGMANVYLVFTCFACIFFCPGGLIVFANIAIGCYFLLSISHSLLGLDTWYSRSPDTLFSSTYFVFCACITYLILDPVVKAAFTLRCFHSKSYFDGADLRVRLSRIQKPVAILLMITASLCSFTPYVGAQEAGVGVDAFDAAVNAELEKPRYNWRFPRAELALDEASFAMRFFEWVNVKTEGLRNWLKDLRDSFGRWVRNTLGGGGEGGGGSLSSVSISLKVLVWILIILLGVAFLMFLHQYLKQRNQNKAPTLEATAIEGVLPDLEDEMTLADALPEDEWRSLAIQCAASGDYRLAMRAVLLTMLAHFARHEFVRIARHKSNLEYRREYERRDPVSPEARKAFAEAVLLFESVWYGEHPASPEAYERMRRIEGYLRFDAPLQRVAHG